LCDQNSIEWIAPRENYRTWPPETTIALVADIDSGGGAVNVYRTPGDKFVDGIGEKDKNDIVLVLWDRSWWYYTIGSVRIGYIKRGI
jgi:hypothetical protein